MAGESKAEVATVWLLKPGSRILSPVRTVGTYNVQVTEEPTRPGTSLGCLYVVCSGTQKPKASCLLPGVKETVLRIRGPYSVKFSRSVVSDSLRPHGLQHTRLPCLLPPPGACSNSCPLSLMPSNHLILCRPLLFPPSIFPQISLFQ